MLVPTLEHGNQIQLHRLFHGPNAAWADAATDAATYAQVVIGDIFEAAVLFFYPADGGFRTCF